MYKAYVTDALKAIVENTSKAAVPGVGLVDVGGTLSKRWVDVSPLIDREATQKPEKEPAEDTRTCREITDSIWERMRGGK